MPTVNLTQEFQPTTTNYKKAELNRLYRQRHHEYTECSCGIVLLKSSIHNHLKSKKHLLFLLSSHSPNVVGM